MRRNPDINNVLILGGHIQAVGLLRQTLGLPVTICVRDKWAIARFSKYTGKTIIADTDDKIKDTLKVLADKNTLLVPTSDDYIEIISGDYEWFNDNYTLLLPSKDVAGIFQNKRLAYSFCERNGISQPLSYCPDTLDDVKSIAASIAYPVVLKPAVMYDFHSQFGKKAFLCRDAEQLIERVGTIAAAGYAIDRLLIQEFLSGGPQNLYSVGVFAIDGEINASITANRIRQNPIDFGNSTTFAVTCQIHDIEQAAQKIIAATHYSGLAEVEFMYDSGANVYKFLEINTRSWKWHTLSLTQGFGFMSEVIRWHKSLPSEYDKENYVKAGWVERLTDYAVIIKNRLCMKDVINSYKLKKCSALLSADDPLPAIMYIIMSPVLYLKRY